MDSALLASPEHRAAVPERLTRVVTHIAEAHGLTADVRGYPVTVNDATELDRTARRPVTAPDNHSALARFDDAAIPVSAALLAGLALDRLAKG